MTTTPELAHVPVRSALGLTRRWAALLQQPLIFETRTLWLTWFDSAGLQSPVLIPIEGLDLTPPPSFCQTLRAINETVVEGLGDDAHLALALCRPGEAVATDSDDEWVDAFSEAFDGLVGQAWSLQLIAGGRVVPLVEAPETVWVASR